MVVYGADSRAFGEGGTVVLNGGLQVAVPLLPALQRHAHRWLHEGAHWLRGIGVVWDHCKT